MKEEIVVTDMKLNVFLDAKWVKEQTNKGVRVVRTLEKWARGQAEVKLVSSSTRSLVFALNDARRPSFAEALEAEIGATFGVKKPASVVSYSVEEESASAKPSDAATEPAPKADVERTPGAAKPERREQPTAGEPKEKESKEKPEDEKPTPPDPAQVLDELLKSVPFRDSRPLAEFLRETHAVIPMLKRMDALPSLWGQHLLLAIDEGYGISEFLKSLARLYDAHGLVPGGMGEKTVREMKVGVGESDSTLYGDWDRAVETARDMAHANARGTAGRVVLCLDVGAWQGKLATPEVKTRLRQLNAHCGSFTCVFRIPFVESRALSAVLEALNDILNVKPLVITPVSVENLAEYADAALAKRGFNLVPEARTPLEQWLIDEKSDDSFFGYRTVDKVVNRIIYDKALSNCRTDQTDRQVTPEDVRHRLAAEENEIDPAAELDALVGLGEVKKKVLEIVAQIKAQRALVKKGRRVKRPSIHMVFTGNPGTGKTTVARLVARLLREEGVLRKGHLVEVRGRDLCGEYIGQTAPRTSAICRDAYGSVLFIDEAYSLFRGEGNDRDYGREALDTLVAEMENHRDDLCVILAGYTDDMETMLEGNAGLKSRIPYFVDFPNYSREDLVQIFFKMVDGNFAYEKPLEKKVRDYFNSLSDEVLAAKSFSNARFVRNLYERTWGKAAFRSRLDDGEVKLLVSDLVGATGEREFRQLLEKTSAHGPIGFGSWAN